MDYSSNVIPQSSRLCFHISVTCCCNNWNELKSEFRFLQIRKQQHLCSFVATSHRIYSEADSRLPSFPDRFQVAKYSIYEKVKPLFVVFILCTTLVLAGLLLHDFTCFTAEKQQQLVCAGAAELFQRRERTAVSGGQVPEGGCRSRGMKAAAQL